MLPDYIHSKCGSLRVEVEVLFITSLYHLLKESSCPSTLVRVRLLCSLGPRLRCLPFLKVDLVDLIGQYADDPLTQNCICLDRLEEAKNGVIVLTLPQQEVVACTLDKENTRLQVPGRLNQVKSDQPLLPFKVLLFEEFSKAAEWSLVEFSQARVEVGHSIVAPRLMLSKWWQHTSNSHN